MRLALPLPLFLAACGEPEWTPVDLGAPLGPDQARAGLVTDPAWLMGGISAEGRVGDAMLVNDRARFVVQGPRPGSFYFRQGGGVIDADVVRPTGEPGRDIVEELAGLYAGLRLLDPTSAQVVDDGVTTGVGRVVVSGSDAPLALIQGVLEAPDFSPSVGSTLTVEYALKPGSWFLEVTTTVRAGDEEVPPGTGDILIVGGEVSDRWHPTTGFQPNERSDRDFMGAIAHGNDVAVMVASVDGSGLSQDIPFIDELGDIDVGVGKSEAVAPGGTLTYTRLYGVGPDLATLTGELLDRRGIAATEVGGVVTSADGPVAKARVVVFLDDNPWTVAVTGEDGSWSARVPEGRTATWRAVGRSTGRFTDLPAMTGHWSPFVGAEAGAAWLDALRATTVVPLAPDGRGVATEDAPLTLGEPARVVVTAADGLPFEVRARRTGVDPEEDTRFVPERPSGATAQGWSRDGSLTLWLEPGTYDLLIHRGSRFERHSETITVEAGAEATVTADLAQAYTHAGWLQADPHQHASPSNDGKVSMEERLIVNAARGIQLPFGTDHDRLADYNVLIEPLGLGHVLRSVVADEVSPVQRGHINTYPVVVNPDLPNNGAYLWYETIVEQTETQFANMRAAYGSEVIFQANHPIGSSGLAGNADWSPGRIGSPDHWTTDFQAIEVLNGGSTSHLPFWMDLVARGQKVTPTGVSDAHAHTSGGIGFNTTFLYLGADDVSEYTDAALVEAFRAGRVVVSRGPFLELSELPGSTLVGATSLTVTAKGPSWMDLDRVQLWKDGELAEEVAGATATFELDPEQDAVYVVMASGDGNMGIVDQTPWAMSGAYYVDVAGDGWTAPLPPLVLAD
jgi:hypothetical protein